MIWLSPSKRYTWKRCKKRYESEYIKKKRHDNFVMARGRNEHLIFQRFFDRVNIKDAHRIAKSDSADINDLTKYFNKICLEITPEPVTDFAEPRHLMNFAGIEARRYSKLVNEEQAHLWMPLKREVKIRDRDWHMSCIIDRVDFFSENVIGPLDYKTGLGSSINYDVKAQLLINVICLRKLTWVKAHGYKVERMGGIFVDKPIVRAIDVTERSINYLKNSLEKMRAEIAKGEFPPNVGWDCVECVLFEDCEKELTPTVMLELARKKM